MKLSDLPDIEFVSADEQEILSDIIKLYTEITGRTLAQGDPVRLFLCVMAAIALVISTSNVMAGSKGAAGFTKATQEVSSYQTPVSNLMKAIAAVIVLVGAFNVYFKMQNGDQDVKKTIMLTIGGCIAFIALSEALPLFFQ